jgi:hypothetical protein
MPLPFARTSLLALLLTAVGCGPTELPAFANPPPYDAGADQDAGPDR